MSDLQPIIEIVDDQLVVAEPSEDEVMASFASQIDDMVDHFWRNTHQLAIEHALLANRQNVQAQHQQAALFAVHRAAESNAQDLAARQEWTAVQIEHALANTRSSLQEQLLRAAESQQAQLNESQEALRLAISQLVTSAQSQAVSTHQAIARQATETMRLEHRLEAALRGIHEELLDRANATTSNSTSDLASELRQKWGEMEANLRQQLAGLKAGLLEECVAAAEKRLSGGRITRERVKQLIQRSTDEVEERMETNLRQALQAAREGDHAREQELMRAVEDVSLDGDKLVEERLRAEMRHGQATLKLELESQTKVLSAIESRITEVSQGLATRIEALEQGRLTNQPSWSAQQDVKNVEGRLQQLEVRMGKMESKLHEELKQILLPLQREALIPRGKKARGVVSATQKAVKSRAEVAARYYDLLCKLSPHPEETKDSDQ